MPPSTDGNAPFAPGFTFAQQQKPTNETTASTAVSGDPYSTIGTRSFAPLVSASSDSKLPKADATTDTNAPSSATYSTTGQHQQAATTGTKAPTNDLRAQSSVGLGFGVQDPRTPSIQSTGTGNNETPDNYQHELFKMLVAAREENEAYRNLIEKLVEDNDRQRNADHQHRRAYREILQAVNQTYLELTKMAFQTLEQMSANHTQNLERMSANHTRAMCSNIQQLCGVVEKVSADSKSNIQKLCGTLDKVSADSNRIILHLVKTLRVTPTPSPAMCIDDYAGSGLGVSPTSFNHQEATTTAGGFGISATNQACASVNGGADGLGSSLDGKVAYQQQPGQGSFHSSNNFPSLTNANVPITQIPLSNGSFGFSCSNLTGADQSGLILGRNVAYQQQQSEQGSFLSSSNQVFPHQQEAIRGSTNDSYVASGPEHKQGSSVDTSDDVGMK